MYIDHYRLHPRAGVHGWGWPFSICLFYSLSYLSLLNDYCSDRTSQVCITEFLFQPGSKMIALWHAHCQRKTNMNKVGLSAPISLQDLFFKPCRVILVMSLCQGRLSCKAIKRQRQSWAESRAGGGWSGELCRWCCAQGAGRGQMDTSCAQVWELPPVQPRLSLASVPCCKEQPALCLCWGKGQPGNLFLGPGKGSGHKIRGPVKLSSCVTCQAGLIEQNYITQHYSFLGYQYCQLTA